MNNMSILTEKNLNIDKIINKEDNVSDVFIINFDDEDSNNVSTDGHPTKYVQNKSSKNENTAKYFDLQTINTSTNMNTDEETMITQFSFQTDNDPDTTILTN